MSGPHRGADRGLLARMARWAVAAPIRILLGTVALAVAAAVCGFPVAQVLSAGGFDDPSSESSRADGVLADRFHQGDMKVLVAVTSGDGVHSDAARTVGLDIVETLRHWPHITDVTSPWTEPAAAASDALISSDGNTGLITAGITGDDNAAQRDAQSLGAALSRDRGDITVRVGGPAAVYAQISQHSERALTRMEAIALPLSFLVLVWVFGGVLCAAVPVLVGILAIAGSMAVLRAVAWVTDVSVFALNLSVALGLALAIDYTLLVISRFRNERAGGAERDQALVTTMRTAGRTVVFSAVTVGLAMLPMALFPMYFLKSFAYAGVAVVSLAAVAALVVTPAAIVLLGARAHPAVLRRGAALTRGGRHRLPGRLGEDTTVEDSFWFRAVNVVIRHAFAVTVAVLALLALAGTPFLGVKWGSPDDRVLPPSAAARQVGDQIRRDFSADTAANVTVVVPDVTRVGAPDLSDYAARLSQVPEVISVSAPAGQFAGGARVGDPAGGAGIGQGSAYLRVSSAAPLYSPASDRQLDALHRVDGPAGASVLLTGEAQTNRDNIAAVTSRLPLVLGLITAISATLLFLLSGSLLIPLKALFLNVLSLSASFGAIVWLFQQGHLGGFGTAATGTLSPAMPVLLFCIAFGISMDYEVFLVARIREYWLVCDRSPAAHDESVALGLTRTGRVITAAAAIMSISFAALGAADVSFLRMFGVGLTLAILLDATVIRTVLVPALMHLTGRWNWWAPPPLARLHDRFGVPESATDSRRCAPGPPAAALDP